MRTKTENLFLSFENSYLERCKITNQATTVWKKVLTEFPPEKLHEFKRRPSLLLAKESGDLGVALLWSAQATLIRPLFQAASEYKPNHADSIGALAIVEDKNNPFTVTQKNDRLILNGKKKYITGGTQSDFILLTEKNTSDKKISSLICLETKDIPESAFQPLDLGCLKTSRHSSLILTELNIPSKNRRDLKPRQIRKMLKVWGIIERSLIMESVTGLFLYLLNRIKREIEISFINDVEVKLEDLSSKIDQQIKSALSGEFIQPIHFKTDLIRMLLDNIKQYSDEFRIQKEDFSFRINDLQFFLRNI